MKKSNARVWFITLVLPWIPGCEKNESPSPAPEAAEAAEPAAAVPTAGEAPGVPLPPRPEPFPAAEPLDRAEALGFARYIPADAEALVSFHNGRNGIEKIQRMKLWSALSPDRPEPFRAQGIDNTGIDDELNEFDNFGEFQDLEGLRDDDVQFEPAGDMTAFELLGTEVTLALGAQGTGRLESWLNFNRRTTYHQMRALAGSLSGQGEETGGMLGLIGLLIGISGPDMYQEIFRDPVVLEALEAFHMPPIYFAVRADEGKLQAAHRLVSGPLDAFAMFPDATEPVEIKRAGTTFTGIRLLGPEIAEMMKGEDSEELEMFFGPEGLERILAVVTSREIVAVSGIIDEYAVLYLGSSIDEFKLAETPEDAITHGGKLAFADPRLLDPFYGILYGDKPFMETLLPSLTSLADIAEGLGDGLAANDPDGRNRDLIALLQIVAERERVLRALATHETTGLTIVDDGGLRIDAHGGTNGMLDFTSPSRLAALGDVPETAMFLNYSIDERYNQRSLAYQEAFFQTAYAIMLRIMEEPEPAAPEPDAEYGLDFVYDPFASIRGPAALIEMEFRDDIIALWQALAHDMSSGLGGESAYVVDFNGSLPVIPGVPEVVLEHATAPRITMLAPVADRESLAAAWSKIQSSGTRITTRIGEMRDSELPMPRPIQSQQDGLTSWFLPLPFFTDEFLPSVTLDDRWFSMGTSREQAVDLIKRIGALEPRPGGGLHFRVNFRHIAASQREQLATLAAHRDAIIEAAGIDAEEYQDTVDEIETLLDGLEAFEDFEVRCWKDGDLAKTRVHLRLRR